MLIDKTIPSPKQYFGEQEMVAVEEKTGKGPFVAQGDSGVCLLFSLL